MPTRRETPLRCPISGQKLQNVRIIPLGPVTADVTWELHAGWSPEYGWFQAEVVSRPPREIFPVERPGGVARPIEIDGQLVYAFPTIYDSTDRRTAVDMYDPDYWQVDWSRLPEKKNVRVLSNR